VVNPLLNTPRLTISLNLAQVIDNSTLNQYNTPLFSPSPLLPVKTVSGFIDLMHALKQVKSLNL